MNVKQAVPFFKVSDMKASIRFYVDGLGCEITQKWEAGRAAALVLADLGGCGPDVAAVPYIGSRFLDTFRAGGRGGSQSFSSARTRCSSCDQFKARGLGASRPFVSNGMWLTSLTDPDGYKLDFESDTDVPEGTRLEGEQG